MSYRFIFVLLLLFLAACKPALPPGTVASVNGEYISLHSVQALLDSRSASLGIPARPSVSEMRKNYAHALSILITHALVRQELAARGIEISEADMELAINGVREDFGDVSLTEYLAEDFLREEDWRQLFRDQLALEAFTERVLLPSVRVSLDEIRAWYKEHQEDFKVPENYNICYGSAKSREELEAWCKDAGSEKFDAGSCAQCQQTLPEMVPSPWQAEVKKLKPGSCARPAEIDGLWRTAAVIDRQPARILPLSEVYALIENIIIEQKKLAAFDQWLERRLADSSILALPDLFAREEGEE